jgi:hypothetical protein
MSSLESHLRESIDAEVHQKCEKDATLVRSSFKTGASIATTEAP